MSIQEDIIESLKYGLLDMYILFLLNEEDMYGYQLKLEITRRTNGAFISKEGTFYGPLYRLEKKGLISSYLVPDGKRTKRIYHLEQEGKAYLDFILKSYNDIAEGTKSLLNWSNKNDK